MSKHAFQIRRAHWQGLGQRLANLSPRAVLQRGYAIVTRADGSVVSRTGQVQPGEPIRIDVSDGRIDAGVK